MVAAFALVCGCEIEPTFTSADMSPRANFEAFWHIFDREYGLFGLKDADWDEIYSEYSPRIDTVGSDGGLFAILTEMAERLHDGHISITAGNKSYRCSSWKEEGSPNFADSLVRRYLPHPEYIGVVTYYGFIADGTVAYLRFPDFNKIFTNYNYTCLDAVFNRASAIIVDIRQNMGGNSVIAETFASHFHDREVTVGYHLFNNGRHSAQQAEYPATVFPSDKFNWSGKPVAVLTDRGTYSSANYFVLCMRQHPYSTIIGDLTGGGAGLAVTRELPNGWQVNLSAGDTLDSERKSVENGIEPDIIVLQDEEDTASGKDSVMEAALKRLAEVSGMSGAGIL